VLVIITIYKNIVKLV